MLCEKTRIFHFRFVVAVDGRFFGRYFNVYSYCFYTDDDHFERVLAVFCGCYFAASALFWPATNASACIVVSKPTELDENRQALVKSSIEI